METKNCKKCQKDFDLDSDDLGFYEKMKVPVPNVCPDCRFKMRAMWRNEMTLYSGRKCAMCDKSILSMYNPKSPYKVFCYDCFYSEKWDPKDYAMDYDKSKPFFEQMDMFLKQVPKINLGVSSADGPNLNSEYVNMASGCKNCYLIFNTSPAEELLYSRGVRKGVDSSDIYFGINIERCYEGINVQDSSGVIYGQNVNACVDSMFLLNCSGLTNCFGCVNLKNKSNCFLNEQLSHEDYLEKINEIKGSYQKMEEAKLKFLELTKKTPRRINNNFKNVNSTGDYISECKNTKYSFEASKAENCRYLFSSKNVRDSIGTIGYGTGGEHLLEVVATGYSSNVIGSYWAENSSDIMYSFDIRNCHDCIGCDALKNGKYAIFNKEYSKEEYEDLKNHIVSELTEKGIHGLMMPTEIAPFGYNETVAQDNLPLTKEEATASGFRWEDDIQMTKGKETLQPEEIPDNISQISESITKEILKCIECERNYKIIDQEFLFYKKLNLPVPRKCFFCRHKNRVVRRGSFKFFKRNCSKCGEENLTNLSVDTARIVYCEKCYQQEVY